MQKQANKSSRKSDSKNRNEFILLIKGIIIQTVAFIAACFYSLFIDINSENLFIVSLCTFSFGALLSGFIIGRAKRNSGLINGMVYSLPSTILFPIISVCLNNFKIDFHLIISVLCMLFFSATGGVISVNVKKKIKIRK